MIRERLGRERKEIVICDTCIEAVQSAGFGDLEQHAAALARIRGHQAEPHECESPECECSCLSEFEREGWKERTQVKIPRWHR